MRFRHLADIHIRNIIRHRQYRKVFDRLYSSLGKRQPDQIVIVGDIRHNKTNISPQYINLASQFLIKLNNIAPLVVVPGNHDCNLMNKTRCDSVSPLVQLIKQIESHRTINIIQQSGYCPISKDFAYINYSIFDKQNYQKLELSPKGIDETWIALYHGIIDNSHNKRGYRFKQQNDYIQLFSKQGCDYGFFGDIHTAQILQDPKYRYCGSLIQQNHGQQLLKGYMLWDIQDKNKYDVKFMQVQNDYKYITVNVYNDKTPQIQELTPYTNLRLRFKSKTSKYAIKKITSELRKKCNNISYIKQDDISQRKMKFRQDQSIQIHDRKFLLKKYFQKKGQEIDQKRLMTLDQQIFSQVKDDYHDKKHRVNWTIRNLSFNNIFNYGRDNVVDFQNLSGLNGVFGANRSGKSSFLDIILVAIFGRSSKTDKVGSIVNQTTGSGDTKIQIKTGLGYFLIQRRMQYRQIKGKKYPKRISTLNIAFKKELQDEWISDNKIDKPQTQRYIQSRFGRFQTFIISAFAGQKQIDHFINIKQRQRIEALIKYFGLDVFYKLYLIANEKKKTLKNRLQAIRSQFPQSSVQQMQQLINSTLVQIDIINQLRQQVINDITNAQSSIKDLYQQLRPIDQSIVFDQQLYEKRQRYLNQIMQKTEYLKSRNAQFNIDDIKQKLQKLDDSKSKIQKIKIKAQHDNQNLDDNFLKYSSIQQHQVCTTCPLMIDLKQQYQQKQKVQQAVSQANKVLEDLKQQVKQFKNRQDQYYKIKNFKNKLQYLKQLYDGVMFKIKYKQQNKQNISKNEQIRIKIKIFQRSVDSLKKHLKQFDDQVRKNQIQKIRITQRILNFQKSKQQVQLLYRKLHVLQRYCQAVNYEGIPKHIIDYLLPKFQDRVNQIISQIDDLHVNFLLQSSLQILIDGRPVETASGMQQLVFSFAFRMRLAKYQYADLFVIDQSFGPLDSQNQIKAGQICKTIPQYFTHVFVVSHIQVVKDFVDNIIQIKKIDGRSKIFV